MIHQGTLGSFNIAALCCTSKHSLPEDKCKNAACGPLAWIRVRLNRGPKMRSEPRAVRDIAATRMTSRMTQGYSTGCFTTPDSVNTLYLNATTHNGTPCLNKGGVYFSLETLAKHIPQLWIRYISSESQLSRRCRKP